MVVSLNSKEHERSIAVDLDKTLAEYDGWKGVENIGLPYDGARKFTRELKKRGLYVIIHTCRINPRNGSNIDSVYIVAEWLRVHGMEYSEIWSGEGKPIVSLYVDDRAQICSPAELGATAFELTLDAIDRRLNLDIQGKPVTEGA